jgi:uncharacterized protein (TIGR02266 family)
MIVTKILLADSDRIFIELGKTFLRKTGVEVLSCMTAEETARITMQESPDMVFMSINLAAKNGLECLHSIKMNESTKDIPVVIVSTSGHQEEIEKYQHAKCDEIIFKPVSRHTFLTTVNKFLDLEKRLTSRFEERFPVSYGLEADSSLAGYCVNLSAGGLFVESRNAFPVSTELMVDFLLPNTDIRIQCKARVAWLNCSGALVKPSLSPGMGLQFLNMAQEGEVAIKAYLRKEHINRIL